MTMPNRDRDRKRDDEQIELERLLFRYSMALERGDFATVATILEAAEGSPNLNRMIQELDAAYITDIDLDTRNIGDNTMAQLTRPLILPQKQKYGARPGRSHLLFPFAAMIAVALVGFSLLTMNPQPTPQGANQGQGGVSGRQETATPTPIPFVPMGRPSEVPMGGATFVPTVPPPIGNPTLVPEAANGTYTSTPFGPTQMPTVVPPAEQPTLIPGGATGVIDPISCEGITRGTPETHLYTQPFVNENEGTIIGLYQPNILVTISDVATDADSGQTWYYVGVSNIGGQQGWTNSSHIELNWSCSRSLNEVWILTQAGQLIERLNLLNPVQPVPMSMTAIPFITPTSTPFAGEFATTPSSTPFVAETFPPTPTPLS